MQVKIYCSDDDICCEATFEDDSDFFTESARGLRITKTMLIATSFQRPGQLGDRAKNFGVIALSGQEGATCAACSRIVK